MRGVKGYILWVGQVKRKRVGGNHDSCRIIKMVYVAMFWG
jgi:hypothetical protein